MKIAPLAEVKNRLSSYVEECKESPVIITKNGKAVAFIAPVLDDDDLDAILLTYSPRFRQLVDDAVARYRQGDTLTEDEFWTQMRNRRTQQD